MLIYHPAFDMHHCIFRMLQLLIKLKNEPHDIEKLRILDFYLLFPQELDQVRFPRGMKGYQKGSHQNYEKIENPYRVFSRLEQFHLNALKCLAAYNLVDPFLLPLGKVQRTKQEIPNNLLKLLEAANSRCSREIDFLTGPFGDIDLYGKSGLKERTRLLEFKYDPS